MRTRVYTQYSSAAKKRGHSFSLTKDEFYDIIEKSCHYCGGAPSNVMKTKNANGEYVYNGVDRFDSSRGYETGNVFPCCKNCNYMKRDLSYDEFIAHIRLILGRLEEAA
jgi:hypothetical protein